MNNWISGFVIAAAICTASVASAAIVTLDNKDSSTVTTTGSQATFGAQTFRAATAGPGTNDSVAAATPLPATVYLQTATFVKAPSGSATAGPLYIDVYATDNGSNIATGGTYIGSSTNAIDVNNATALADVTWNFASLAISSSSTYSFAFSTDAIAGGTSTVGARLAAANFGGGFVSTYSGGTAYNSVNPPAAVSLDARFATTFDTVPEPTGCALAGVGGLLLLARRRRV
jgi:hypothetical protein